MSRDVAIIAVESRFPGARDVHQLWDNLVRGRETIIPFGDAEYLAAGGDPESLDDPDLVKVEAAVDGIDLFDAAFFGYRKAEAELIDPQQRLFLEVAYHALEQSGYVNGFGGRVGVYGGATLSRYYHSNVLPGLGRRPRSVDQMAASMSNSPGTFATRVSYDLNLTGPGISVHTACSTGLVAVHLACRDLADRNCDLALAGAASLNPTPKRGYRSVPDGPFSPDGHCRVFDAKAAGMIPADGVGVVVLKRLADALADDDRILAVVKGTAINNDGHRKAGFTAPSPLGQAEVIMAAQAAAGVPAASIGFVEAHGTATPVGDPIEVQALTTAFARSTSRTRYCALGSVKSNIGHTDTAAGIAGLIKAALAVHHGTIPASINFTDPNPLLDLDSGPFYVNAATIPWPAEAAPRRAGVSSFGVGGTNAHVILEQAPAAPEKPAGAADPCPLIVLSARTPTALRRKAGDLANHLAAHPGLDLADVAYTSQVGRRAMPHRQALVRTGGSSIVEGLRAIATGPPQEPAEDRPVVFLFPGTGAHYDGMGRALYETEPVFRAEMDRCAEIVLPITRRDPRTVLYDEGAHPRQGDHTYHLDGTARTGPPVVFAALLATEYAMARWLMSVGVRPAAMLGHSFGEYTAACLSGVLPLDEALRLVVERERLFALAGGTTYSVALGEEELRPYLTGSLALAAVNGPANCAVSGTVEDVTGLAATLAETGVKTHQLRVTTAMHSALLDPVLGRYAQKLRAIPFGEPRIPYISTATGTWITTEQAGDPGYWIRQTRHTVRFADGLDECGRLAPVFVEVGPDGGLGKLARRQLGPAAVAVTTMRHAYAEAADQPYLRGALGQLWRHGVPVDWPALHAGRHRRRIPLPGYPFERQRFWIDPPGAPAPVPAASAQPDAAPRTGPDSGTATRPPLPEPYVAARNPVERQLVELWEQALGITPVGVHDNFFDLGGESLVVLQIVAAIRDRLGVALSGRKLFIAHRLTVAGFAAEIAEQQAHGEEPR